MPRRILHCENLQAFANQSGQRIVGDGRQHGNNQASAQIINEDNQINAD
ncbi:hypothetical protein BTN50_1771 (plasmid) [Candidatus Enterovibrio altilux]|uniref:Uncharacterized protein n=1 Tax=Candidatus Enterovibrio altilux TaxID=1927128 RepID=A0A291BB45_9GAMM|nr:hypothetical protein BTN50_1771 [Candidatus Enterovibrio luxaltus]